MLLLLPIGSVRAGIADKVRGGMLTCMGMCFLTRRLPCVLLTISAGCRASRSLRGECD